MSEKTQSAIDQITATLHKRAEKRLRSKIEAAFESIRSQPLSQYVALPEYALHRILNGANDNQFWLPCLIDAAQEALYTAQVDAARAEEVAEFLAKVETTAAELDAIREEMHQ